VGYDPWEEYDEWEFDEGMEADYLQNDIFKDRPIPRDLITGIRRWTIEKFTKSMWGLIRSMEGDRDES